LPVAARISGHYRWVICGLLFFAATVNSVDRQVIGLLKPTLQTELHWNEIDDANIVFAFRLAFAAGLLLVGRAMDWLGTRRGFSLCRVHVECCGYGTCSGPLRLWFRRRARLDRQLGTPDRHADSRAGRCAYRLRFPGHALVDRRIAGRQTFLSPRRTCFRGMWSGRSSASAAWRARWAECSSQRSFATFSSGQARTSPCSSSPVRHISLHLLSFMFLLPNFNLFRRRSSRTAFISSPFGS